MSDWHTKKILVVDDSAFMRQIVINSVKQASFTNIVFEFIIHNDEIS